jgi:hypothetical protein
MAGPMADARRRTKVDRLYLPTPIHALDIRWIDSPRSMITGGMSGVPTAKHSVLFLFAPSVWDAIEMPNGRPAIGRW